MTCLLYASRYNSHTSTDRDALYEVPLFSVLAVIVLPVLCSIRKQDECIRSRKLTGTGYVTDGV